MGRMAGPDTPPSRLLRIGLPLSTSITMPGPTVLISVRPSAPAAATARAISTMLVTFGDSFTKTGMDVAALTAEVAAAAALGSSANDGPNSAETFGHETFTSIRSGRASLTRAAISPNSFTRWAKMLAMKTAPWA